MIHVEKPTFINDLGSIQINPIKNRLQTLSEKAWSAEDSRKENDFSVFHSTQHIVHRFTRGNETARNYYETNAWHIWRDILEPVMEAAANSYGYAHNIYPKAMFARLKAGAIIHRHRDGAGSNLESHKIHIPIVTNPNAKFIVADKSFHLEEGRAYEVNNIRLHGALNDGEEDRIHFIFEVFDGTQLEL